MRQQVFDVLRGRALQLGRDRLRHASVPSLRKRFVQKLERPGFGIARVRGKGTLTLLRFEPASRHGNDFLVQPRGTGTVERKPAKQNDTRNSVRDVRQTSARQIVVNEALS